MNRPPVFDVSLTVAVRAASEDTHETWLPAQWKVIGRASATAPNLQFLVDPDTEAVMLLEFARSDFVFAVRA